MATRTVYASQVLAVYISGPDLDQLLQTRLASSPVFLGQIAVQGAECAVSLNDSALHYVRYAALLERQEIARMRAYVRQASGAPGPKRKKVKDGASQA
jgi:hypothetical protein